MTMQYDTDGAQGLQHLEDEVLVDLVLDWHEQARHYREVAQVALDILEARMAERGARLLPHPRAKVELPLGTAVYDYGKLAELRELLPMDVLDGAYVEAWDEQVPARTVRHDEKWDGRALASLARSYGKEVTEIISLATRRSPMKIKVTPNGQ